MTFAHVDRHRSMRTKLRGAIARGRLAVLDVGSSKITCLILRLDPERMATLSGRERFGPGIFGALEVVGARTVQSRGVRRGEIVDMNEAARAIAEGVGASAWYHGGLWVSRWWLPTLAAGALLLTTSLIARARAAQGKGI